MSRLTEKKCINLKKGTPGLSPAQQEELGREVPLWSNIDGKLLRRELKFSPYLAGPEIVKKIAELSESENHHPDIIMSWGKMVIEISTHTVGGLSENDYILAAKIDALVP